MLFVHSYAFHLKASMSSELVALYTFYQSAMQCLILQHASRVQCQSYCGTWT